MNVYLLMLYNYPYSIFSSKRKANAAAKALAKAEENEVEQITYIVKVSVDSKNDLMEDGIEW